VELVGCDMLREAARDCRVVVLCATESEAEPIRAALLDPETHVVATKTLHVGELAAAGARSPGRLSTVRVVVAISGCDKANAAHILTCLLQAMVPPPTLVIQAGIAGALPGAGPGPGAGIGDIVIATEEAYSDTGSSSPEGWLPAAELGLPIARVRDVELGGIFPLDIGLALAATDAIHAVDWSDEMQFENAGAPERGAAPEAAAAPESALWPTGVGRPGASPAVLLGTCVTASQVTGLDSEADEVSRRWGALSESMEGAAAAHICALYAVPFLEIRGISNMVTDRDRGSWQVERAVAIAGKAALAVARAIDRLHSGKRR
jgi:futalosine hydrolase